MISSGISYQNMDVLILARVPRFNTFSKRDTLDNFIGGVLDRMRQCIQL